MHRPLRCRCGHGVDAHEHFRPGRDCGACTCRQYRERPGAMVRLPASASVADASWRRLAGRQVSRPPR